MESNCAVYYFNCLLKSPFARIETTNDRQNSLTTNRSVSYGNSVVKLFLIIHLRFLAVGPGILSRIAKVINEIGFLSKYEVVATVESIPCIVFSIIFFELVGPVFTPLLSGTEFEIRTLSSFEADFKYCTREAGILTLCGLQLIQSHSLLCPTIETTGDSRNDKVILVAVRRNQGNFVIMIYSGARIVLPALYINYKDARLNVLDINLSAIVSRKQVSSTTYQFCIRTKLIIPVEITATIQLDWLSLYTTISLSGTCCIIPRNNIPAFETIYCHELEQILHTGRPVCTKSRSRKSTIKNDTVANIGIVDTHRVCSGCIRFQICI